MAGPCPALPPWLVWAAGQGRFHHHLLAPTCRPIVRCCLRPCAFPFLTPRHPTIPLCTYLSLPAHHCAAHHTLLLPWALRHCLRGTFERAHLGRGPRSNLISWLAPPSWLEPRSSCILLLALSFALLAGRCGGGVCAAVAAWGPALRLSTRCAARPPRPPSMLLFKPFSHTPTTQPHFAAVWGGLLLSRRLIQIACESAFYAPTARTSLRRGCTPAFGHA